MCNYLDGYRDKREQYAGVISSVLTGLGIFPKVTVRKEGRFLLSRFGRALVGRSIVDFKIVRSPGAEFLEDRDKCFAEFSYGILHPGWHFGIDVTGDNAVFFKLPKLLGEHLGIDPRQSFLQFTETHHIIREMPEDEWLPFAPDYLECSLNRAVIGLTVFIIGHGFSRESLLPIE